MKTREQIYGKEATDILRNITTYHYIRHDQLLRFYPGKEDKTENLLSFFVKQGRIFTDKNKTLYHDGTEAKGADENRAVQRTAAPSVSARCGTGTHSRKQYGFSL